MPTCLVRFVATFAGTTVLLSGCGGSEQQATATTCPPSGTTLTYQSFGQPFFDSYCLRCHSSALTGAARNGAPVDVNFNTVEEIRTHAEEIHEHAGASGDEVNDEMPPSGDSPSVEERRQLSEWLFCGAP